MIDITSVYNALSGFVGENWAGSSLPPLSRGAPWRRRLWPRPRKTAPPLYKLLYAVTDKIGCNFGKARNAVPGNTGK